VSGRHREESGDVGLEAAGGVQTLTLDRPEKKNALTGAMYGALARALRAGDADPAIHVHLLQGAPGVFCAGNDLADFLAASGGHDFDPDALAFLRALAGLEKPLVAAVDGLAVGVGVTMLLHCDLVFASPGASFRTPFVDLGLVPEAASSLLLPARIGHARAFEMLCLGAPFDAERARAAGLVNAVYPSPELEARAREAALALAAKPQAALRAARTLMRRDRALVEAVIDEEIAVFKTCVRSPEAREAFQAFLEKRPPDFARARAEGASDDAGR